MNDGLADDLLEFLFRVRLGRKNDKLMRNDALVLALRVTELKNVSPQLVKQIVDRAVKDNVSMVGSISPYVVGSRKIIVPEKKKSPPRRYARAGLPETVNQQRAG